MIITVEAAERVFVQAASTGWRVSTGADTKANTWVGGGAHFSSLSTPFSLMQLAMMMAEATPRYLFERSIRSVGSVPLSSSI